MYIKFIQSPLFKPVVYLMILVFTSMSFTLPQDRFLLSAGTPISLETLSLIDSNTAFLGQLVDFRVTNNVYVDGEVVIEANTIAKGQVTRVQKNGAIGRPGTIIIQIRSVTAVDGQEVFLSGGNIYQEGEDKQVLSILLGVFVCVLCLFIKGKDAVIQPGLQVSSNVASDAIINM